MTVVGLLERKNLCFRSFLRLCEEFLDRLALGDVSGLEKFQNRRRGLIEVLEHLDREIGVLPTAPSTNPGVRAGIDGAIREKDLLIRAILDADLKILAGIDRAKAETVQKLHSLHSGRKTIGAYRSPLDKVEYAENSRILDKKA